MSYTMTMEPEVQRGAEAYAARKGMTLEDVIKAYLVFIAKQEEVIASSCHVGKAKRKSAIDLIGCCRHFNKEHRSTAEIMKELREGEED